MKNRENNMRQHQKIKSALLLSLIVVSLFLCGNYAWANPKSGGHSDIGAATSFLKKLTPGISFAQCKRILPAGALITRIHWDEDFDTYTNIADLRGTLNGYITVSNKLQESINRPKTPSNSASLTVHGDDPVRCIKLYMDTSAGSKVVNHRRILAISRYLGKPLDASFGGDPQDSSWAAHWRTQHNLTVEYSRQAELVNSYAAIPVLMAWTRSSSK